MVIRETINDSSALNSHSYTISAVPANTKDIWKIKRITSMRYTTESSYNGLTVTVRPLDTINDTWDTILVELINVYTGSKNWNNRVIDLNIYYTVNKISE